MKNLNLFGVVFSILFCLGQAQAASHRYNIKKLDQANFMVSQFLAGYYSISGSRINHTTFFSFDLVSSSEFKLRSPLKTIDVEAMADDSQARILTTKAAMYTARKSNELTTSYFKTLNNVKKMFDSKDVYYESSSDSYVVKKSVLIDTATFNVTVNVVSESDSNVNPTFLKYIEEVKKLDTHLMPAAKYLILTQSNFNIIFNGTAIISKIIPFGPGTMIVSYGIGSMKESSARKIDMIPLTSAKGSAEDALYDTILKVTEIIQ